MKKVVRDNMNRPIGWMDTKEKRGTIVECATEANFAKVGTVAETMQSLNRDMREYVNDLGELK